MILQELLEKLIQKQVDLENEIERLKTIEKSWSFIPLTAPLTSASFNGDSFSTTSKTKIDLSSVFGAPAGIKAVTIVTAIRDSGSLTNECWMCLGPTNATNEGPKIGCSGLANDFYSYETFNVPCDSNGDIYYQILASGTGTMDVWLEIWGYWL